MDQFYEVKSEQSTNFKSIDLDVKKSKESITQEEFTRIR